MINTHTHTYREINIITPIQININIYIVKNRKISHAYVWKKKLFWSIMMHWWLHFTMVAETIS